MTRGKSQRLSVPPAVAPLLSPAVALLLPCCCPSRHSRGFCPLTGLSRSPGLGWPPLSSNGVCVLQLARRQSCPRWHRSLLLASPHARLPCACTQPPSASLIMLPAASRPRVPPARPAAPPERRPGRRQLAPCRQQQLGPNCPLLPGGGHTEAGSASPKKAKFVCMQCLFLKGSSLKQGAMPCRAKPCCATSCAMLCMQCCAESHRYRGHVVLHFVSVVWAPVLYRWQRAARPGHARHTLAAQDLCRFSPPQRKHACSLCVIFQPPALSAACTASLHSLAPRRAGRPAGLPWGGRAAVGPVRLTTSPLQLCTTRAAVHWTAFIACKPTSSSTALPLWARAAQRRRRHRPPPPPAAAARPVREGTSARRVTAS